VGRLVSACPYLLTQPCPLAFVSLFRWGHEVGDCFTGLASPFEFTVDEAIEAGYAVEILDVVTKQGGWEPGRWSRKRVWRAFRAAQGYVREVSGGFNGIAWREKMNGRREYRTGSVERGQSGAGVRKRKMVYEESRESGAGGKRRKPASKGVWACRLH
jgi:hypothetical protein